MTLPANIRLNTSLPFPALVTASGPITLSKVNGIWTVGLSFNGLAQQNLSPANYATELFLVYDSVGQTFFKAPIASLPSLTRNQTVVAATPYNVVSSDMDLFVKLAVAAAVTINFPLASTRGGISIRVKDLAGVANSDNISCVVAGGGGDLFDDGGTTYKLNSDFEEREFVPVEASSQWYWSVR